MSIVPYGYQLNSEYSNYSSFPTEGSSPPTSASAMSQINWQATYPSQIAPVNTAMSTLFPPYSRGSSQKVGNIKTVVFLYQAFCKRLKTMFRLIFTANGLCLTVIIAASTSSTCATLFTILQWTMLVDQVSLKTFKTFHNM